MEITNGNGKGDGAAIFHIINVQTLLKFQLRGEISSSLVICPSFFSKQLVGRHEKNRFYN